MSDIPTADDLRRWALRCATEAAGANEPADRERLLRMRDAFAELAENEAWLAGLAPESEAEIKVMADRMAGHTMTGTGPRSKPDA